MRKDVKKESLKRCEELCKRCVFKKACGRDLRKYASFAVECGCCYTAKNVEWVAKVKMVELDEAENLPVLKYAHWQKWADCVIKALHEFRLVEDVPKAKQFYFLLNLMFRAVCDCVYDFGREQWKDLFLDVEKPPFSACD